VSKRRTPAYNGRSGKNCILSRRPKPTEQRRAKNKTSEEFADHRRLADALHDLSQTTPDGDQEQYLDDQENSEGCAVFSAAAVAAGGISKKAMGSHAAIRTVREAMLGPSEINPLYSWKFRVPRQLCGQRPARRAKAC